MVTWGVIATLMGFVHTVGQFYALRFLLGLAEAGFYPGVIIYLTHWFPERQRSKAISLLSGLKTGSIMPEPKWKDCSMSFA